MPLSEHEQKLLEQIERELVNDDPKFVSSVRSADSKARARRKLVWAVLLGILGLGLLVVGAVTATVWIGVLGFLVMFGGATLGVLNVGTASAKTTGTPTSGATRGGKAASPVKNKLEDRFRRRYEG